MLKKRMTVQEAKTQFPEAFRDANGNIDKRIDEVAERHITHFLNEGESPYDAKIKALCVAIPPDHYKVVPGLGGFPKLMYHEDGRMKPVEDAEEQAALLKKEKGWGDKASKKHLEKLQRGSVRRDERISSLQRELDSEIKARDAEKQEPVEA